MKKILETSLGRWSELTFSREGRAVGDDELVKALIDGCGDYKIYSKGGVVVHMTEEEYRTYQTQERASSIPHPKLVF